MANNEKTRREKMIERLVDDAVDSAANDRRFVSSVFHDGHKGFENMTDEELERAYDDAGLEV